uniref:Cystatin-like n=1 Tax=Geotrypetes seraphini TaxID=260995 RepID=A0A6P8R0S7_GEOSA|nr:cystatin-like [Geotrypetes seraphini]
MANLWLCFSVILSSTILLSSAGIPGGPINIDPNTPEVQEAARYALTVYNQKSENANLYKIVKIQSAQSQVVAGVKYTMVVEMGLTQCKKGSTDNAASCSLLNTSGQTLVCTFVVLEQAWINVRSLLDSSCTPSGQ